MSAQIPTITLNDGNKIPSLGFGTGSAFFGKDATSVVKQAIEAGFTHLDGAQGYANEDTLGNAISQSLTENSSVPRSSLFVTTKLGFIPEGQNIRDTLITSLKALKLDYVDLFLIHSPTFIKPFTISEAWKQFEEIQKEGLAKSIGVSNFRVKDLEELLKEAKVIPAVNQIEYHPYTLKAADPIVKFQSQHGILTESYGGLTSIARQTGGPVDPVVTKIKERLIATSGNKDITEGQVLLKWLWSKGIIAVTTSSKKERLQEYLTAPSVPDLTAEEVKEIDSAGEEGKHYRHYRVMKHMDE